MAARILSISYEPMLGQSRQWVLESEGYAVTTSASLEEAVRFCETGWFDVMVLGHCIPTADKQRLIGVLRSVRATPVLALLEPGERQIAGADYNLEALVSPEELTMAIKKILAKAHAA